MENTNYARLFALLALLFLCSAKSPAEESYDYVLTVGNETLSYVACPQRGYVVKAEPNSANMGILAATLFMADGDVTPIRGLDRQGIWVVENEYPAAENENTIGLLATHSQVQYAAPLFSSNGDTVAVIPEIVIRVKPDTQIEQIQTVCQTVGCKIKKRMEFTMQEYLLEVLGPDADAVFTAVEQLNGISLVEWACPNTASQLKLYGQVIPSDEYFPMQWHLHNTGQSGGTTGADINAPAAWEITTGDPNIIVAVVDCGVDTNHPDLINNLVPGYDFLDDDEQPDPYPWLGFPDHAHGTACAGLVAAKGSNNLGVTGVTWNCKVMPIRMPSLLFITEADKAEVIRYAAEGGADVLSNSWGGGSIGPIIHSAIVDITEIGGTGRDGKGCIVFFAAGNRKRLVDGPAIYPEVIAVGATDHNDHRCYYSNYGSNLDIVAPSAPGFGDDRLSMDLRTWVWTTDISGPAGYNMDFFDSNDPNYTVFGGTSASTPIAAGVAALILSVEANLTNEEVRRFLEHSAKDLGDPGWDISYGHGRVDARAAVELAMASRADLNDDCFVNLRDFSKLAQFWMQDEASVDIYPPPGGDGIINVWDVITMGEYWLREIPKVGLVAHWELDETEGSIAHDSVGNNDATLHEPEWIDGKIDGALQFNGLRTYMDCGHSEVLGPEQMTLAMWLWPEHMGGMRYVLSRANESTDVMDYMLMRQYEGELELAVGQLDSDPAFVMTTAETPLTEWSHAAICLNGSAATIYVNGQPDASVDYGQRVAREDLRLIISSYQVKTRYFNGKIDDVRTYNFALSQQEIAALCQEALE